MKKIALMVFGLLIFSGMAIADQEDASTEGSVSLVSEVSSEELQDIQHSETNGIDDSEVAIDESIAVEIEADQPDEVEEEEESEEEGEDDLDGMD